MASRTSVSENSKTRWIKRRPRAEATAFARTATSWRNSAWYNLSHVREMPESDQANGALAGPVKRVWATETFGRKFHRQRTASATFSRASPKSLGACSPRTMCSIVMIENAMPKASPCLQRRGVPRRVLQEVLRLRVRPASQGPATQCDPTVKPRGKRSDC